MLVHLVGYSAPGREKVVHYAAGPVDVAQEDVALHRAKAADAKESFECGREDDAAMPNIWLPDGIEPGFKEACLEFFWAWLAGYLFMAAENNFATELSRNRNVNIQSIGARFEDP